jgi:hypothetical protein
MAELAKLPREAKCWCGWYRKEECPKTESRCTGALEERLKEADRYRWLRDNADIRFDCGGWVVGFDNWIPIRDEVYNTAYRIDTAIDEAMRAATDGTATGK